MDANAQYRIDLLAARVRELEEWQERITKMPTVTLTYTLPDEQDAYDAARTGADARLALWQIDQRLRDLLKHGEPSSETGQLAEEIRGMIPPELLD